jgi:choline dehydrogenase-like flavoprotein
MSTARQRNTSLPERTEVAVLGSGPGGSMTACLLAEAGRDVVLVEEGPHLALDSCAPFSRDEMVQKYRNGGLTVALGRTKVAYVEGRCVGGGSEINSGLHHRTPPEILEQWRSAYQVEGMTERDLLPHFQACEKDLCVSLLPGPAQPASLKLHEGATNLGWGSVEVPRWFAYQPTSDSPSAGIKQSMTQTLVPRALRAGARLVAETRVRRLRRRANSWHIELEQGPSVAKFRTILKADKVFIACGAIQTPALLQRSGLSPLAGRRLHMHPTVKVIAQFPEEVNAPRMGVPVHQVKEFSPRFSFGCSISAPPHLALAMLDHSEHAGNALKNWRHFAIYYAMIGGGQGTVRALPYYRDPLVRYRLAEQDLMDLAEGLRQLCRCLFAAGAQVLFPTLAGSQPLRHPSEIDSLPTTLPAKRTNLMTIHLFSSCPLGENRRVCVADSFGRVHGEPNLWIADGSLLPGPPGVNPQGSILAITRRNACHFLEK